MIIWVQWRFFCILVNQYILGSHRSYINRNFLSEYCLLKWTRLECQPIHKPSLRRSCPLWHQNNYLNFTFYILYFRGTTTILWWWFIRLYPKFLRVVLQMIMHYLVLLPLLWDKMPPVEWMLIAIYFWLNWTNL